VKSTDVEQNRIVDAFGQESAKVRILIATNEGDRGAGAVGVAQHPDCGFWGYRWVKRRSQNSGFWFRFFQSVELRPQKPEFYACPNG